ncbi:MAG TPA: rhomboid family intramembrane serine protease [Vampirovibrionales bacterium]
MKLQRQKTGSVGCPSCGEWVDVNAAQCPKCSHPQPGYLGYYRFIQSLNAEVFAKIFLWFCGGLFLISILLDYTKVNFLPSFNFLSVSNKALVLLGAGGALPIFKWGNWWAVFSASLLHGSFFHIAFNFMWLCQLAPLINKFFGFSRLISIFVLTGAIGAFATAFAGEHFTGFLQGSQLSIGASTSVFGFFGVLIAAGQQSGSKVLRDNIWLWALIGFASGFLIPNVDNWGHFGGFAGGYLLAITKVFNYKQKENIYDYIFAGFLMLVSVVSVFASVYLGLFVWKVF